MLKLQIRRHSVGVYPGGYQQNEISGWAQGDWNGDIRFDEQDFVKAFIGGGYLLPPRTGAVPVPEPSTWLLSLMFIAVLGRRER